VEIVLASALSVSLDARAPLDPSWAEVAGRLGALPPGNAPAREATRADEETDLPGLRWALDAVRRMPRQDRSSGPITGLDHRGVIGQLREARRPHAVIVPAAARIGIAVAAGVGLGRILGLNHAYWVGLTAAAALQASNVTFVLRRLLHRLAGTIAGVGLAGAVFAWHPGVAVVAVVATGAQFIHEIIIRVSYGLAVIFVTVLALSMYDLAVSGAQIGAAVGARVLDTIIGAALVIALRLVLWPRATAARVPQV
jgi:uncharacterized membrane protein YccC